MNDFIKLIPINEPGLVPRTERSDAAANRVLILATAERLFAERGVTAVHMADVAEAAGVGKGTLYRRFANKAELCLSLLNTQLQEFQDTMLARMRVQTAEGVSYREQLDQFLDSLVYFTEIHSPLLCEVQRGEMAPEEWNFSRPHYWLHMTISGLLRKAIQAGELPPHLDADYLADALLSPLRVEVFGFQRLLRGFSLERISAGLRSLAAGLPYI
jgi:AcrR family transcriptional regulator